MPEARPGVRFVDDLRAGLRHPRHGEMRRRLTGSLAVRSRHARSMRAWYAASHDELAAVARSPRPGERLRATRSRVAAIGHFPGAFAGAHGRRGTACGG